MSAFSNCGPTVSTSTASTRSQNTMQCGLPIETQLMRYSLPPMTTGRSSTVGPARVTGTSDGFSDALPISTETLRTSLP